MTRKALYIVQGAPYSTSAGIEALEMAMISASFEQSTSMLFIHDGVFQLRTGQQGALKDSGKMFKASADFDIAPLYVDQLSLQARGISVEDLLVPVELLTSQQVAVLLAHQDQVITL